MASSWYSRLRQTRGYDWLRDRRYLWRHRNRRQFYARFVSRDDLVFDVGANVGHYTLLFLNLGAKVVAVEPQATLAAGLRQRFPREEKSGRLVVANHALGAESGEADLHKSDALSEIASLRSDISQKSRFAGEHTFDSTEHVRISTLDALIARHGLPRFCKIDVEGYEAEVLAGLHAAPHSLSLEVNREFINVAHGCIDTLSGIGAYRFNYTRALDSSFALQNWVDSTKLHDALNLETDPLFWGDVYATLSPHGH